MSVVQPSGELLVMPQNKLLNLLGLCRRDMEAFFVEIGEKPFRATQIIKWIHQQGVVNFDEMLNLSKSLRTKLKQIACIKAPEIIYSQRSKDGTHKWVLRLDEGNDVEMVFIPEQGRGTLCVSSQVGCALECSFCSTAQQGFNRNLSSAEIIGQLWTANQTLPPNADSEQRVVSNVVLMGMGEPLLNFDNVVSAMDLMMEDHAYGLSKRRVTLSTSGVIPAIDRLRAITDVSLAVSLHAPNNDIRSQLVPLNKKYPLEDLLEACKRYFKDDPRRKVTIEYVMLLNVNDQEKHARQLVKVLEGVPSKVNLIPFNPFPNTDYECSDAETIARFKEILVRSGVITTVRKTRGDDIDAACGQLVGKVKDKTKRTAGSLGDNKFNITTVSRAL